MKFRYYRLFLEPIAQLSLLPQDAQLTKQEMLIRVFNPDKPLRFSSGSRNIVFMPKMMSEGYILGSLARRSSVTVIAPPEEDSKQESVLSWPFVNVIINTSNDPKSGQSVAIEFDQSIFQDTLPALKQLVHEANKMLYAYGYEAAINPINKRQDFWDIVSSAKGKIKDLTFTFNAPNLFQTDDKLNDELREATRSFMMTKATIQLENPEGNIVVPESNSFIKQSVQYIADGGGEYKIKAKGRRTYSSTDSVQTREFDEVELEVSIQNEQTFSKFCDKLFLWLKSQE